MIGFCRQQCLGGVSRLIVGGRQGVISIFVIALFRVRWSQMLDKHGVVFGVVAAVTER